MVLNSSKLLFIKDYDIFFTMFCLYIFVSNLDIIQTIRASYHLGLCLCLSLPCTLIPGHHEIT